MILYKKYKCLNFKQFLLLQFIFLILFLYRKFANWFCCFLDVKMGEMKPHHQMFLQYFMLHGLVDSKGVRNLFKTCCERYSQPLTSDEAGRMQQLANFVITINRNIRPFHLTIRKGFDEDDSTCFYCLVNTCDSPITRLSSDYTVNELELFKLFLGSIMMTDDAAIGSVEVSFCKRVCVCSWFILKVPPQTSAFGTIFLDQEIYLYFGF